MQTIRLHGVNTQQIKIKSATLNEIQYKWIN